MWHNSPMTRKVLARDPEPRYTVQVGARGRLVLPSEVRKKLTLEEGDSVVLSLEADGSLRLRSLREQVKRGMGLFRDLAPGVSLADELLQERREEAKREELE